jgi:hypothetical protein
MASLLFLAAAVFVGGCSSHSDSFGEAGSSGSSGASGSTGSTGSAMSTDLAVFARAGIADAASADAREVNDLTFTSDENPDAFNDVF